MVAAGVEHMIAHQRSEELGERYGTPYHHQGGSEEPLYKVHSVDSHHLQSAKHHEQRNQECRQSERTGYQEVRYYGSQAAADVLELPSGVLYLARSQCCDEALVGLRGVEVAHESYGDIYRYGYENKAINKVCLVVYDIVDAYGAAECGLVFRLFLLRHDIIMVLNACCST